MLIIAFDTSTKNLSVALYNGADKLCAKDFQGEGYVHSEMLLPFINETLNQTGKKLKDLEGVLLSLGPGSYTGLRIGASAAKSLAYSLEIPVFGLSSNEVLYWSALKEAMQEGFEWIAAMIDARRDEVYYQLFKVNGEQQGAISSVIVDQIFLDELKDKKVLLVGDGALKFENRFELGKMNISKNVVVNSMNELSALLSNELNSYELNLAYFDSNYVKAYQPGKKKSIFS